MDQTPRQNDEFDNPRPGSRITCESREPWHPSARLSYWRKEWRPADRTTVALSTCLVVIHERLSARMLPVRRVTLSCDLGINLDGSGGKGSRFRTTGHDRRAGSKAGSLVALGEKGPTPLVPRQPRAACSSDDPREGCPATGREKDRLLRRITATASIALRERSRNVEIRHVCIQNRTFPAIEPVSPARTGLYVSWTATLDTYRVDTRLDPKFSDACEGCPGIGSPEATSSSLEHDRDRTRRQPASTPRKKRAKTRARTSPSPSDARTSSLWQHSAGQGALEPLIPGRLSTRCSPGEIWRSAPHLLEPEDSRLHANAPPSLVSIHDDGTPRTSRRTAEASTRALFQPPPATVSSGDRAFEGVTPDVHLQRDFEEPTTASGSFLERCLQRRSCSCCVSGSREGRGVGGRRRQLPSRCSRDHPLKNAPILHPCSSSTPCSRGRNARHGQVVARRKLPQQPVTLSSTKAALLNAWGQPRSLGYSDVARSMVIDGTHR